MIKLYLPFLLYGFFLSYVMIYMWGITGPVEVYAYVVLAFGLGLGLVIAPLALYKARLSAIIGETCLLISLPMFLEIARAIGFTAGFFTPLLIISLIMFVMAAVNGIRIIAKTKFNDTLPGRVKVVLSVLPLALFFVYVLVETYH